MKTPTPQKAHRSVLGGTVFSAALLAAVLLVVFTTVLYANADDRTVARDRGTDRTITPTPAPAPTPTPVPTPTPPPPSGGINSVTDGSVSSGDNTGGTVTTGDEHTDVHEVNIGPTNNPPPPPPPSTSSGQATPPAPQCDPRGSRGCSTSDSGRAR